MCNIKHIIGLVLTIYNAIQFYFINTSLHACVSMHLLYCVLVVENRSIPSNKFELHGPPLPFLFKHKFA
ncbi:unnamed protein product [Prunus brigantina]